MTPMLETRRQTLVALRRASAPVRAYELADRLGVSYDAALRALDWLAELGLATVTTGGWTATHA